MALFNKSNIVWLSFSKFSKKLFVNGAEIVYLGQMGGKDFDLLTLPVIREKSYSTNAQLLDTDPVKCLDMVFGIHTNLGQYAKIRIADIGVAMDQAGDQYYQITLEVYIFR